MIRCQQYKKYRKGKWFFLIRTSVSFSWLLKMFKHFQYVCVNGQTLLEIYLIADPFTERRIQFWLLFFIDLLMLPILLRDVFK